MQPAMPQTPALPAGPPLPMVTDFSPQQPSAPTQVPSPIVDGLRQRNFEIPDGMTDEQALEALADQIDEANDIRNSQTAPAAPGMQPAPAKVPTPAAVPSAGSPKPSADAERMVQAGLLSRGADGHWVSTNPALQSFAQEYNDFEAYSQATARQMVTDFDGFFQSRTEQLGVATVDTVTEMQKQIKALQSTLAESSRQQGKSRVDQWAEEHSPALFVNGDENRLTPYAQKYNAFAEQIDSMALQMGQTLDTVQIHDRTIEMLAAAGLNPDQSPQQPAQVAGPAQQQNPYAQPQQAAQVQQPYQQPAYQPPAPPATFMQQAAQTQPRLQHNRLTEHPAQQPNGIPHLPTGKGGKPKLGAIISGQQQNGYAVN
jgi:hypothetical protein